MEGSLARALFSFQSSNSEDLSVPEGGVIRIQQYLDKYWLKAEYEGQTGLFPISYAVKLDNEPKKRDIFSSEVTLHERENQEFTFGKFHQHDNFSQRQVETERSFVQASFGFVARNEAELTAPKGAVIEVTKDVDDDWLEGSFNGHTGLFPKSYVKSPEKPRARAIYPFVGESVGELTFREGDCIYLRKRLNSQWMEGEINGNVGIFPSSFVVVDIELPLDKGKCMNGDLPFVESMSWEGQEHKKTSRTSKTQWKEGMKGKAKFNFSALYSGDLELNKGDVITVLRLDDDNWLEGQLANGVTGLCPTAYLEPVLDSNDHWPSRNLPLSQNENFQGFYYSHLMPKEATRETSNNSYQDGETFGSYVKSRRTDSSLLDSSFRQDPTPLLRPNTSSLSYTGEKSKSQQYAKPMQKPLSSEGYSVTYLGSGKIINQIPSQDNYETATSPSGLLPPLLDEQKNLNSNYVLNAKTRTLSSGISRQPEMQFGFASSSKLLPDSFRTWQSNRNDVQGYAAGKILNQDHGDDDDYLLSGNCTSLPSPLFPLPQAQVNSTKTESSEFDYSPITPKRPAPPPPKRNSNNINQFRSNILPASWQKTASQGDISPKTSPKMKGHGVWEFGEVKQSAVPAVKSLTRTKRDSSHSPMGSPRGSPRVEHRDSSSHNPGPGTQQSQLTESSSGAFWGKSSLEEGKANRQEQLARSDSNNIAAPISNNAELPLSRHRPDPAMISDTSPHETEVPGIALLEDRIVEAEQNLKKEMNVHAGFKSIAQLVMTDPVKQREMEVKVSQSQQKISEWQEELKNLKDEKVFVMESHRKKMLKNKIAHLEADLEKQVRSQRSLEMLLGVVEENRKKEVLDNLGVCAQLVENIKKQLAEIEASLHNLTEKPAASSQKHMAEQRRKVVTEIVNTERDYCNDLELCVKHCLAELQSAQVKDLDCDGLFGNIESVLETSKKLLKSIEEAIENNEEKDQELGKCFVDIAEEMKEVYAVYCRNHDDAISLVEKYEDVPEIQDAFSKCMDKIREHTRCWDLSSFLIKPVQRVLKYPLLLNELLKYTPEIHRDKYNLIQAISVMTDVANAINEFKRRKDLVVKYKKVEDSGLTNRIQKLSWHSVVKKGNRFNQRLTQLTGLVSQTVDEKFIEEEKKFRGIEKTVKVLWKNISTYLAEFKEVMECGQASGGNVSEYYQDVSSCIEVSTFYRIQKTIGETILDRFMDTVHSQVLSPLNALLSLFQGPQRLIQKRNDKCLDYDSWSNKIDKIKDRDKLKTAKEELKIAKKNYEALNTQLLEEIPGFTEKCMTLVVDCMKNFALAHNNFYHQIRQEYEQLLQLSIIQSLEADIVEQHNKRSALVIEQFADLSFIPCSFVAKDGSRKKRRSVKSPNVDTPATEFDKEDERDIKLISVDSGETETSDEGRMGAPPSPSVIRPQPAPRRISSNSQPNSKGEDHSPRIVLTPGDGKLHVVEFNFEAQNAGELSVFEGEIISVLRYSDTSGNPEWWLIQRNGATGYVPQNFLTPVNDNETGSNIAGEGSSSIGTTLIRSGSVGANSTEDTKTSERYCAEFEFVANSPAELNLEEGQYVVVLQKQDLTGNNEWWLVEAVTGQKGYVPSSYLTSVED